MKKNTIFIAALLLLILIEKENNFHFKMETVSLNHSDTIIIVLCNNNYFKNFLHMLTKSIFHLSEAKIQS